MKKFNSSLYFAAIFSILTSTVSMAQTYSISGRVTDQESENGLQGVVLSVADQTATTDEQGNYEISDVSAGEQTVQGILENYNISNKLVNVNGNMTGQIIVAKGEEKILPIDAKKARKDTTMLCLDGCKREGTDAWNKSRLLLPSYGIHDRNYCVYTAVATINKFYGGTITLDECAYQAHLGPFPDHELAHGAGANYMDAGQSLSFALNNATSKFCDVEPTNDEYKSYIDANRPIYYANRWTEVPTGHAMVIAGYKYVDKKMLLRFLNTDNNGAVQWYERGLPKSVWLTSIVPSATAVGRKMDPLVEMDTDGDGVNDYDEKYRWDASPFVKQDLDENKADTDKDGLPDGKDIEGWLFRGGQSPIPGGSDLDGDKIRSEVDPDSDNGGVLDGDEDVNLDANPLGDETNPYSDIKPNTDDIPNVKIVIPSALKLNEKTYINKSSNFEMTFLRKDQSTPLRVFSENVGPLVVEWIPNGGQPLQLTITPSEDSQSSVWTGTIVFGPATPSGKAEFRVKNGSTVVEVIVGKDFYIDANSSQLRPTDVTSVN